MKRLSEVRQSISFFLLLSLFIFSNPLFAQTDTAVITKLFVSSNKTTSLVFPQIIKSVDRGSKDFLVQKVNGVENVLQVRAAKENFNETNMTVITADGKLYPFVVQYAVEPPHLSVQLGNSLSLFEKIANQNRTVRGIRDQKYEMSLRLKGLYIEKDILYYQLEIENLSNVTYDIDMLRFYIRDKKLSRRTATQELDQVPLYIYGNAAAVPGMSNQTIIVAIPKFTIPDKKLSVVQLTEKNGGRNLRLQISNRKIVRARPIL